MKIKNEKTNINIQENFKADFKIVGLKDHLSYKDCVKTLLNLTISDKKNLESHEYEILKNGNTWALITTLSPFLLIENEYIKDLPLTDGKKSNYSVEYSFNDFSELANALNAIQRNIKNHNVNSRITEIFLSNSSLEFSKRFTTNDLSSPNFISDLKNEFLSKSKTIITYFEKNFKEELNQIRAAEKASYSKKMLS